MITVFAGMFLYAIIHSVMAGQGVKAAFRRRFGERAYHGLYRLVYNMVAGVTILPVMLWIYVGSKTVVWTAPGTLEPALLIVQAVGMIGLSVSLLQIDMGRFSGLSQLQAYLTGAPLPLPEESLQIRGVYGLVRHPLYLFSVLVLWPVTSMTDTLLAFNLLATLYFIFGSRLEEKRMVRIFGQDYVDYQQRVPWLVPFAKLRR